MDLWDAGALGMVETQGLTASIVAVDVMGKAAEVRLIGVQRIGDGIVTVSLVGDMASVTSAVESARQAVAAIGGTVVTTVIGRPAVPTDLLREPRTGGAPKPPAAAPPSAAAGAELEPGPAAAPPAVPARRSAEKAGGSPTRSAARSTAPKRRPPAAGPYEPPPEPPAPRARGK
ncbi:MULTISPECIES: BMC domain-containing protein [unclassified Micromonospora]|uniref:BMC domain-containing protein n=2 Tax=Micromonospora TaxID=1873 RepID=UPI0003EEA5F2|nr:MULTISPECIES: BMC domain-containing protein [unclassified Micromonospora]EWM64946.1 ethanolamine utilization protein [Micromonospora sp. M42]MCK1804740.1 BMC domain-containing protein [Micromonospora sp. R42106]MCM1016693.1 BMC domain-containing protein [Micromonospora sp. XM-20-01]